MNDYQIGKKEYQRAQDSRGDHEADGRERLLTDENFFGFYADTDNSSKSDGKLSALKHASLNKKTVVFGMGIGDITGPVVGINIMGYEDWNVARAVALFRQSIGSGDPTSSEDKPSRTHPSSRS
ncbi:unnamed protein product [Tilletia controversa]|nr:unnamed protein product [Tilletia controversa]